MMTQHLTANEIAQYTENELNAARRAEIEQHLAACAACRAHIAQGSQLNIALRALPRTQPPRELAARIGGVVETRVAQEQARRARLPFVAIATFFSVLLLLWFCGEMIVAFQENSVLDFFALFTSYPDWFSTDSLDALLALIEALPITEILLTLCALLTVGVFAQQLVNSLRPRAWQFK